MKLDRNLINYLKAYFVPRSGIATIQNDLTPESGYTVSLGSPARPFDSLYVRSIVSTIHADSVNGKTANDITQFIVGEEVDILDETPRIGFIAFGETTKRIYFGTETEWIELASLYNDTLNIGADTNLYRSAANLLKTDDALLVMGNITTADYLSTNVCLYIKEVASGTTPGSGYAGLFISNDGGLPYVRNDEGISIPLFERSINFDVTAGRLSGATRSVDGTVPCIILRNGYTDYVNWNFVLPPGWAGKDVNAVVYLSPSSTNTGATRFYTDMKYIRNGSDIPGSPQTSYTTDVTMPGVISRVMKIVMPMTLASFQEGDAVSWGVVRLGTATEDTFTGNNNILAVELQLDVTM